MNTQPLINSTLLAKASEEVDEQVKDELNAPDPDPDVAKAALTTDTSDEDENGKHQD